MRDDRIVQRSVVQIDPMNSPSPSFQACFAIVKECHGWGVLAVAHIPHEGGIAEAYVRLAWDQIVYIGTATWVVEA